MSATRVITGGGQPLPERLLPVAGAELSGEVPHVAVGDAQPPGELAGAELPGIGGLLLVVPELGDALASGLPRPGRA